MQKFFVENSQIKGSEVTIEGSDMNHIVNVLRMKKDDNVLVGNKEDSKTYFAQIKQINKDNVILEITDELNDSAEPKVEIDLYQGLPKFDKMELIIQFH